MLASVEPVDPPVDHDLHRIDHGGERRVGAARKQSELPAGARQPAAKAMALDMPRENSAMIGVDPQVLERIDRDRPVQRHRQPRRAAIAARRIALAQSNPPPHRLAESDPPARLAHFGRRRGQRGSARGHRREIAPRVTPAPRNQRLRVDLAREVIGIERQRGLGRDDVDHDRRIVAVRPLTRGDPRIEFGDRGQFVIEPANRGHLDHVDVLLEQARLEIGGIANAPGDPQLVGTGADRGEQVRIADPHRVAPPHAAIAHRRGRQRQRDSGQQQLGNEFAVRHRLDHLVREIADVEGRFDTFGGVDRGEVDAEVREDMAFDSVEIAQRSHARKLEISRQRAQRDESHRVERAPAAAQVVGGDSAEQRGQVHRPARSAVGIRIAQPRLVQCADDPRLIGNAHPPAGEDQRAPVGRVRGDGRFRHCFAGHGAARPARTPPARSRGTPGTSAWASHRRRSRGPAPPPPRRPAAGTAG